jgi:hypothetical protein
VLGEHIDVIAIKMIKEKPFANTEQVERGVKLECVVEMMELGGNMACHH